MKSYAASSESGDVVVAVCDALVGADDTPCLQVVELRLVDEAGSRYETARTLTVSLGGFSRHCAWLRLREAAQEQWGVTLPATSDPDREAVS